MPMDRSLYPPNWEEIAHQVKEAANWTCQECSKQCYRPGEPALDRRKVLTVHHKDHDPKNLDRANLEALCAPCHLRKERAYKARMAWQKAVSWGQMILPGVEVQNGITS